MDFVKLFGGFVLHFFEQTGAFFFGLLGEPKHSPNTGIASATYPLGNLAETNVLRYHVAQEVVLLRSPWAGKMVLHLVNLEQGGNIVKLF